MSFDRARPQRARAGSGHERGQVSSGRGRWQRAQAGVCAGELDHGRPSMRQEREDDTWVLLPWWPAYRWCRTGHTAAQDLLQHGLAFVHRPHLPLHCPVPLPQDSVVAPAIASLPSFTVDAHGSSLPRMASRCTPFVSAASRPLSRWSNDSNLLMARMKGTWLRGPR
jgi:hypothetical protein